MKRKFFLYLTITISVLLLELVMSGCGLRVREQDIAGFYSNGSGDWLQLDFYDDAAENKTGGMLYINDETREIYGWHYWNDTKIVYLGTESNTSNAFDFGDYYGNYHDGVIELSYEGENYVFLLENNDNSIAEDIYASETSSDRNGPINQGIDKETAQNDGGVYILLDDGSFYPLQKAEKTANAYDDDENFVMTSIYTEDIPALQSGNKLVVFTDNKIGDLIAFPVLENGYTMPLNFQRYEGEEQVVSVFNFSNEYNVADEALDIQANALYADGFPKNDVYILADGKSEIEIENCSFDSFYYDYVIDTNAYCSEYPESITSDGCYGRGIMLADMKKEEPLTISFYQGTQYIEHTLTADLHYFAYDGCEKRDGYSGKYLEIVLTKEGYAEVDTSALSDGYYVLRESNPFVSYHVFKVES